MKNVAICDIDGSFTNNLEFPKLEDELNHLRILNSLKNYKVTKFDSAFTDQYQAELATNHRQFVKEVRNYFVSSIMARYFDDVETYFKEVPEGEMNVFKNYFDEEAYIDNFYGTESYEFARLFVKSASFSFFCDNHISDDLSNFHLFTNIQASGTDFIEKDKVGKVDYLKKLANIEELIEMENKENNASPLFESDDSHRYTTKSLRTSTDSSFTMPLGMQRRLSDDKPLEEWPED